jgi:hypothetical protein
MGCEWVQPKGMKCAHAGARGREDMGIAGPTFITPHPTGKVLWAKKHHTDEETPCIEIAM